MNVNNLTVYVAFLFQGTAFALGNVMIMEIARRYSVDTAVIGYILSLGFAGGAAATLGGWLLLGRRPLRELVIWGCALTLVGAALLTTVSSLAAFAVGYLLIGFGAWVFLTIANYIVVGLYDGERRSAQLNLANFFASSGGLLTPLLAGYWLQRQVAWEIVYACPFIIVFILLALAVRPSFGLGGPSGEQDLEDTADKVRLPRSVGLAAAALFAYCLAEFGYVSWIVVYMRESMGTDIMKASMILTVFYICHALGRLLTGAFIKFVPLDRFIICCAALGAAAVAGVLHSSSYTGVAVATGALALAISGLYPCILSYGTQLVKAATPRLLTGFILTGIMGAGLGLILTSYIKMVWGVSWAIAICGMACAIVALFIGAAWQSGRQV